MRHAQTTRMLALSATIAAVACTARWVAADEVVLTPVADATLYESSTGSLANGSGQHLFTGFGNAVKRGLLRFDVAASVPAGSTVDSVELTLHMSRTIAPGVLNELYRVTTAWTEGPTDPFGEEGTGDSSQVGDVTWIHTTFDTGLWTTPGGDAVPTPSAGMVVSDIGYYTWASTPEMVADVQLWLDAPAVNHGWTLRGDEDTAFTAKRFDTREHPDPLLRPVLRIVYTPAPQPTPTPPTPGVAVDTVTPTGVAALIVLLAVAGLLALRRA